MKVDKVRVIVYFVLAALLSLLWMAVASAVLTAVGFSIKELSPWTFVAIFLLSVLGTFLGLCVASTPN